MPMDWSQLPTDVLGHISRLSPTPGDHARFRAVCRSWLLAAAAASSPVELRHHLLPLLVLPPSETPLSATAGAAPCRFYSLSDHRIIHEPDLPELSGSYYCWGSSFGWLAFLDPDLSMFLLNPLTGARIPLPAPRFPGRLELWKTGTGEGYIFGRRNGTVDFPCGFSYIRRYLMRKLVLSSDPTGSPSRVAAAAIYSFSGELAFCRPGEEEGSWVVAPSPSNGTVYSDVLYYNGLFYAVDFRLTLFAFAVDGPLKKAIPGPRSFVDGTIRQGRIVDRAYLVESSGDLLMVIRSYDDVLMPFGDDSVMVGFEIFKLLDSSGGGGGGGGGGPSWSEVKDLGGRALFLGSNRSVLLSARDFPGCRRNCIYFSDYTPARNVAVAYGGPDFGIYDLENGDVERVVLCAADRSSLWQPTVWATPRFE